MLADRKYDQLITDCHGGYVVAVFGHLAFGKIRSNDFELIQFTCGDVVFDEALNAALQRGLFCLGLMGLDRNGVPHTAFDVPLEGETLTLLTTLFLARLEGSLNAAAMMRPTGDSVAWCERLYRLPDTREAN